MLMKKIFTLIAMATMALGVNAQEIFIPENATTYTSGQEFTTTNCKLVLGDDTYGASQAKPHKAYIKAIGLSTPDAEEGKDRYILFSGKGNPVDGTEYTKDDGTTAVGLGYKPENKNLPIKGCYYMLTPSTSGTISVGIVLNANKAFYVVKKSNGEALAQSAVKLLADGEDENGTATEYGEDYKVSEKLTGTATFDVEANETYYVFCTGSKLGFFGYVFTPGSGTGIQAVKTESADVPAYNLAGQKVAEGYKGIVIQNGVKRIQK